MSSYIKKYVFYIILDECLNILKHKCLFLIQTFERLFYLLYRTGLVFTIGKKKKLCKKLK